MLFRSNDYVDQLPAFFGVSNVWLSEGTTDGVKVTVDKAMGGKCDRCWKYMMDIGANPAYPTICALCAEAVVEQL